MVLVINCTGTELHVDMAEPSKLDIIHQIELLRSRVEKAECLGKGKPSTFVMVPTHKTLKSYSGIAGEKLDDWVCDMRSFLESHKWSDNEKLDYVFQHLTGPAKAEVKYRFPSDTEHAFGVLREVFGEHGSTVTFQRTFFERKQREGENLRDFSHVLLELFDKAKRKSPHLSSCKGQLLNDQFANGVLDINLRRHLKGILSEDPDIDFFALRAEAITWSEEGDDVTLKVTSDASQARVEMGQILDLIQKQQEQLDRQQKQLIEMSKQMQDYMFNCAMTSTKPTNMSERQKRTSRSQCSFCGRQGHVESNCLHLKLEQANKTIAGLKESLVSVPKLEN